MKIKNPRWLKIGFIALPLTILVLAGTSGCMLGSAEGDDKNTTPDTSEIQTEKSLESQTEDSKSYYEITPSDPEWKEMGLSEAYDRTSLKKMDYESMSTEEVLAVCLEYPFLTDIMCYETYPDAIETFRAHAKQFEVLYNRDDAPEIIMESIRAYKQTATDNTEEFKNFNGKETFMFAMLRCYYLDGRLSKEEFKEAEGLHWKHMNEDNVFFGGETMPYDPDVDVVYFDTQAEEFEIFSISESTESNE